MKSIGLFWSEQAPSMPNSKLHCPLEEVLMKGLPIVYSFDSKKFEFQINLWNCKVKDLSIDKSYIYTAIDFGVICPLATKQLAFLLPFKATAEDFEDLTSSLYHHPELLCSIFKEDLSVSCDSTKTFVLIDGAKKMLMYELSVDNIVKTEYDEANNVTLLLFTINSDLAQFEDRRLFVRFRIKLKGLDSFSIKKQVSNDWLQSAFSSSCLFDVRVNDMRELSKKKRELVEMYGCNLPEFSKIHFFYMADSDESIISDSSLAKDSRLLEKDKWNPYLGDNLVFVSDNIAHHWKKVEGKHLGFRPSGAVENGRLNLTIYPSILQVNSFSLFFKTTFSELDRDRIILYVSIIVLLGVFSSAIVTLVSYLITDSKLSPIVLFIVLAIVIAAIFSHLYFAYKSIKK